MMDILQEKTAAGNRLLSLPNELLAQVVCYFSASPADTTSSISPATRSTAFCTDYHTLSSLRLVCKRISAVSQPFMYRVVELFDEKGMVLLIRTLVEHRYLRTLVHHLAIYFEVEQRNRDAGHQAMLSCWADNFVPLPYMSQQDTTVFNYIDVGDRNCVNVSGILYGPTGIMGGILAVVLYLIPAVGTLRMPALYMGTYYNAQQGAMQTLRAMMEDMARKMKVQPALSRLCRLQIFESHPSPPRLLVEKNNYWSVVSTLCGLCPQIQTIETYEDHGRWDVPLTSMARSHPNIKTVAEVCALHCRTLGNLSSRIADSFPNIRRLTLKASGRPVLYNDMPPSRTVDSALLKLANTLEFLHLEFPWRQETVRQLGGDKRLTCLPKLARLKELYIPVGALCNDCLPYKSGPLAVESPLALFSLADNLPNSLESLHLAESLQMATLKLDLDNDSRRVWRKGEYEYGFVTMVLSFCTRRSNKQTKLRHFRLLPTRETDILRSHLPVIKSACEARNMVIEVELPSRSNFKKGRQLL